MHSRLFGVGLALRLTRVQTLAELLDLGLGCRALQYGIAKVLERWAVIFHTRASFPTTDCTQSDSNLRKR